jgi:hypothetical protein
VTWYRVEGTQTWGGIPLPPEGLQGYPSCKTEKVFRGAIVQGVLFVFSKDENFSIFDYEASTV